MGIFQGDESTKNYFDAEIQFLFDFWSKIANDIISGNDLKTPIALTDNQSEINHAIYYGNLGRIRKAIQNPNLQSHHFRFLLSTFRENLERSIILTNSSCPVSILESTVLQDNATPLMRYVVSRHPNSSEEIKIVAALKGVESFSDYLKDSRPLLFFGARDFAHI